MLHRNLFPIIFQKDHISQGLYKIVRTTFQSILVLSHSFNRIIHTTPPDLITRLVHRLVHLTCGALKPRSCSRLHLGIVHALEVISSWFVLEWSLKNEEFVKYGLLGRPRVEPLKRSCSRLDLWIVHAWQVFDSWIVLAWSLKNGEAFRTPSYFFRCNPLKGCISRNRILTDSLGGSKPDRRDGIVD